MGKYRIALAPKAETDLAQVHKSGDKQAINKIEKLIKELSDHPTIGTGKPELLRGVPGIWSRRIDKKNRLVYTIKDDEVLVLVLSALGHYQDK